MALLEEPTVPVAKLRIEPLTVVGMAKPPSFAFSVSCVNYVTGLESLPYDLDDLRCVYAALVRPDRSGWAAQVSEAG